MLNAIRRWHRSSEPETPAAHIPEAGRLPPPQITWPLLGLIHYRQRKKWAGRLYKDRLRDKRKRLPKYVSIDDILAGASDGVVPGLPEWSYHLDGNDSYLTNRVTDEQIHIDILNGPEVIRSFDLRAHFQSLRTPGAAEQRLRGLFPHGRALMIALRHLDSCCLFHLIDPPDLGILEFELCGCLRKYAAPVEAFLVAWEDPTQRSALGRLIGDWPVVLEMAASQGQVDVAERARAMGERSRRKWLNLVRVDADSHRDGDALCALPDAQAEDLREYLEAALADPDLVDTALDIIRDDPVWRDRAVAVFRRSLAERPFHGVRGAVAAYLARHGHPVEELFEGLLAEPADLSSAIVLALKHDRQRLPDLTRLGIRSATMGTRLTAAAALATLDTDWTRCELLSVLEESPGQDATIEARCALRESRDRRAREAADRWEEQHPDAGKRDYTTDRSMYDLQGGCEQVLCERMEALNDQVRKLGDLLSAETVIGNEKARP
jgi:hypothetical protein